MTSDELHTIQIVLPEHTNHYGTLFAGQALKMMAGHAYIVATQSIRENVVMAGVESVDFKDVVRLGEIVEMVGKISKTGKASMTVDVDVFAQDRLKGKRRLAIKGKFIMVAVNDKGKAIKHDTGSKKARR